MNLHQLFEQEFKPLAPGEKRHESGLGIRDVEKIRAKIDDLVHHLHMSMTLKDVYQQDTELQQSLAKLKDRLNRKIQYLERMKTRPSTGPERMLATLEHECGDCFARTRYEI